MVMISIGMPTIILVMANQLSAAQTDEIKQWFNAKQSGRAKAGDDKLFGAYKNSNVIAIQGEAFMNFVIGKSYNGQEITPNINRLMKESMYFSQYYHQTRSGTHLGCR